jgi:hypothetical protein
MRRFSLDSDASLECRALTLPLCDGAKVEDVCLAPGFAIKAEKIAEALLTVPHEQFGIHA